jgi:hypothetical protein
MTSLEMATTRLVAVSLVETRKGPHHSRRRGKDLAGAGDGAAGRGVADRGEERNLVCQVLVVLGFRVRGLAGVCSSKLGEV